MATPSEIRKLYKAVVDDPALETALRTAKTPAEKKKILGDAGLAVPTRAEIRSVIGQDVAAGTGAAQPGTASPDLVDQIIDMVGICALVGID